MVNTYELVATITCDYRTGAGYAGYLPSRGTIPQHPVTVNHPTPTPAQLILLEHDRVVTISSRFFAILEQVRPDNRMHCPSDPSGPGGTD
jgi:hypothetical protein